MNGEGGGRETAVGQRASTSDDAGAVRFGTEDHRYPGPLKRKRKTNRALRPLDIICNGTKITHLNLASRSLNASTPSSSPCKLPRLGARESVFVSLNASDVRLELFPFPFPILMDPDTFMPVAESFGRMASLDFEADVASFPELVSLL